MSDRYWETTAPPGDMRVAKGFNKAYGYTCSKCAMTAMSAKLFRKSKGGLAVCRDDARCANRIRMAQG